MFALYDLGYQAIKDSDLLLQVAQKLDAVVLDVRLSPRARDPRWNQLALVRKFIERYVHVSALGNLNYKDWDAPIVIKDLEKGLEHIRHYLHANNVILLCACGSRETCHRKVIAEACEKRLGIKSTPLNRADCLRLLSGGPADPQLKMF